MSIEVLMFLQFLVNSQQLTVGADDFDDAVRIIRQAKVELAEAIAKADTTHGS